MNIKRSYHNNNGSFKSLLAIGNPIIDILFDIDLNTIKKYGLMKTDISYVDNKNEIIFSDFEKLSKVEYIPGGFIQNILRVTSWCLGMANSSSIFNLIMLGAVGQDTYKEKIIKSFESVGVKYLFETIPEIKTSRCGVGIYKKERYLLSEIRASKYLAKEYINKNKNNIY